MASKVLTWLDERLGLTTIYATVLDRKVPKVNWWFTLGSASLFLFAMQAITGIFLATYYVPSPDHAYDSIQYIMNDVAFGWLIRGIHHWGATLMVIFVFAHMLRTFFFAAYKFPRELTWLTGVVLFLTTLGMGFTGYLLPWNQRAYWATTVGTQIAGTIPVIGPFIVSVLRGGPGLSAVTLARFFAVHIWFLPAVIALTIGIHMYLVIRLGISMIPGEDD
jgi:quinol-cytochrome oxidoreductase complex cytochrome b subunit